MPTLVEWVLHLEAAIEAQARYCQPYEVRYRNEYVLPFIAAEYREVYGGAVDSILPVLAPPQTGTAAIGIDALVERLTITGAMSPEAADAGAVRLVQQAWEDSDLDVMHREAHREALIKSRSFAQVTRSTDGRAIVGIEAPEQMAVHRQQAPPYDVDAAFKVRVDEWTGKRLGFLRLPGRDVDLIEAPDYMLDPEGSGKTTRWRVMENGDRQTGLPGVPVAEFSSRPRLLARPASEIEPIASLVDIVDLIEGLLVFAGHFGAVPIRWASGLEVPRDPKDPTKPLLGPDGKPMVGFRPRADHFWASTSKDAKFGQLEPAGLASFVTWAEHASRRIRAKTTVPGSYYGVDPQTHMSAELLKTDEAPMVRRVLSMGRDGSFGQSWRRIDRYILMVEDPASRARVRPRWADPETRVEAQATDSFQKVVASGVGVRAAAEKILGWDPEFVERAVAEKEAADERLASVDPEFERITRELSVGAGSGAA